MAPGVFLLLLFSGLLLDSPSCAQHRRKLPARENPIDKISVQEGFDPNQFAGKWFLVGVASRCSYLHENSHRLEATNIVVSVAGPAPLKSLGISTFRPLDGICWNVKQTYIATKTLGRYLLTGRGRQTDVVVAEADYGNYAIVYYQKSQKISVKLYGGFCLWAAAPASPAAQKHIASLRAHATREGSSLGVPFVRTQEDPPDIRVLFQSAKTSAFKLPKGRTARVSEAVVATFEERVASTGLNEDLTYYFPAYGFCDSADQFHILDETKYEKTP